jgi:hypothetical protein
MTIAISLDHSERQAYKPVEHPYETGSEGNGRLYLPSRHPPSKAATELCNAEGKTYQ